MTTYMMGLHKHIPGIILFIKYTGVLPRPLKKEETTQQVEKENNKNIQP